MTEEQAETIIGLLQSIEINTSEIGDIRLELSSIAQKVEDMEQKLIAIADYTENIALKTD